MDYERLWKILEALMVELTKKGVTIPQELVNDLKSVKTLISIYKTEPRSLNIVTEIELYLGKIEPNLLYLAESDVSKEYVDEWIKKTISARIEKKDEQTVAKTRFVSGISKGEYWIRIKTSGLINEGELDELLKKFNLSSEMQENGYLLIRGKEPNVKSFVKKVGEKIGKKKR